MANLKIIFSAVTRPVDEAVRRTIATVQTAKKEFSAVKSSVMGFAGMAMGFMGVSMGVQAITKQVEKLDRMAKQSKAFGLTGEQYQKLDYAAGQEGTQLEGVMSRIVDLSRMAALGKQKAQEALGAAGLTVADLAGKDVYAQFELIAAAISNIADQTKKVEAANAIFKESGAEMLGFLASYKGLGEQFEKRGMLFSENDLKTAEKINDAMDNIGRSWDRFIAKIRVLDLLALLFETIAPPPAMYDETPRQELDARNKERESLGLKPLKEEKNAEAKALDDVNEWRRKQGKEAVGIIDSFFDDPVRAALDARVTSKLEPVSSDGKGVYRFALLEKEEKFFFEARKKKHQQETPELDATAGMMDPNVAAFREEREAKMKKKRSDVSVDLEKKLSDLPISTAEKAARLEAGKKALEETLSDLLTGRGENKIVKNEKTNEVRPATPEEKASGNFSYATWNEQATLDAQALTAAVKEQYDYIEKINEQRKFGLFDIEREWRWQMMAANGQEKQVNLEKKQFEIEKALNEARQKAGRDLTEEETRRISVGVGGVYDFKNNDAKKASSLPRAKEPQPNVISDAVLQKGGYLGGQASLAAQNLTQKSIQTQVDILSSVRNIETALNNKGASFKWPTA